jgi:hypothetical protein
MANRAYLYTASKNLTNLKDVSETRSEVSLAYKILLGIETTQSDSLGQSSSNCNLCKF